MTKVEEALEKEILETLETMGGMTLGTDEYEKTVNSLAKLTEQLEKIRKDQADSDIKNRECDLKEESEQSEKKNRRWQNGLTIAGITIPSLLTVWGTLKTLKFEETGTVTSIVGRGWIQKLLPKK